MEFCIISGEPKVLEAASLSLRNAVITADSGQVCHIFQMGAVLLVRPPLAADNDHPWQPFFDGHLIYGNADGAWAGSSATSPLLPKTKLGRDPGAETHIAMWRERLKACGGAFACVIPNRGAKTIRLQLDPMCQHITLVSQRETGTFFSNSSWLLEEVLSALGEGVKRTCTGGFAEAAWKCAFENSVDIEGVYLSRNGYAYDISCEKPTYDLIPTFPKSGHIGREQALDEACDYLTYGIQAIAQRYGSAAMVADLTGGIDSRMVLAALEGAGIEEPQIFFDQSCDPGDGDITIPKQIAAGRGYKLANFPQNFDGEEVSELELVRRAAARSYGCSYIYMFEQGRYRVDGVCRLRGGLGEPIRHSYYRPNMKFDLLSTARRFGTWHRKIPIGDHVSGAMSLRRSIKAIDWKHIDGLMMSVLKRNKDPFNLLKPNAYFRAYQGLKKNIMENKEFLDRFDLLLNMPYVADLCRRHFGHTSMSLNRVRPTFDPLMAPQIWRLAMAYSYDERRAGMVIKALIGRLAPDLLSYPTSSSLKDLDAPIFRDGPWDIGAPLPELADYKKVRDPRIIPESSGAVATGAKGATGVSVAEDFKRLVLEGAADSLEDVCHMDRLRALVQSDSLPDLYFGTGHVLKRIHRGLIWSSGEASQVAIDQVV